MKWKLGVALLLTLVLTTVQVSGYKILGLFPYHGKSHIVMFKSIMEGLALRGHTVHMLSHYPRNSALANYTDLSLVGCMPVKTNQVAFEYFDILVKYDILSLGEAIGLYSAVREHEAVMKSEAVQKLLKSNEKYDLILTEPFVTDMVLGFVHKFKVPFILLSSFAAPPGINSVMANPQNPAFIPVTIASRQSPKMSFLQRVSNTVALLIHLTAWYGFYIPAGQKMVSKYFGDDIPPLLDIYKNASLVMINTHPAVTGGRPLAPTVIEVGGVHIGPAQQLPRDIETFIEESPHGVIYFSMGSSLKTSTLPEEKRNAFLQTFSKLKERILWKFEEENVTVPKNVMVKKWMPQRDILAHPKVKLFISHGGLMGTLEAVSEGKPVVGIPVFAEQETNARVLELQGVAKVLDYNSINYETVLETVQEVLKPKYTENAKELSKQFHDRPMSPMDTVVYWVEYVIRNNGANILRSPAVDLYYHQYLLFDVVLFLLFCLMSCSFVTYYFFKILLCKNSKPNISKIKLKSK